MRQFDMNYYLGSMPSFENRKDAIIQKDFRINTCEADLAIESTIDYMRAELTLELLGKAVGALKGAIPETESEMVGLNRLVDASTHGLVVVNFSLENFTDGVERLGKAIQSAVRRLLSALSKFIKKIFGQSGQKLKQARLYLKRLKEIHNDAAMAASGNPDLDDGALHKLFIKKDEMVKLGERNYSYLAKKKLKTITTPSELGAALRTVATQLDAKRYGNLVKAQYDVAAESIGSDAVYLSNSLLEETLACIEVVNEKDAIVSHGCFFKDAAIVLEVRTTFNTGLTQTRQLGKGVSVSDTLVEAMSPVETKALLARLIPALEAEVSQDDGSVTKIIDAAIKNSRVLDEDAGNTPEDAEFLINTAKGSFGFSRHFLDYSRGVTDGAFEYASKSFKNLKVA